MKKFKIIFIMIVLCCSCSSNNSKRKPANSEDEFRIKSLSEKINNSIQSLDDFSHLDEPERLDILGSLAYVRSKLIDYGVYNDDSINGLSSIELVPISRKSGGEYSRISLSPSSEIKSIAVRSSGGDVKIYHAILINEDDSRLYLKPLTSNESFVGETGKTYISNSEKRVKEIILKSEAWNDNSKLVLIVDGEEKISLTHVRSVSYFCDGSRLYKGKDNQGLFGSSSRCSKTSDALNSGLLYFCEGSRLYKGKDNQGLFGSSSRCSKTSDALNFGVLYFCDGSRLYKGKDNQGLFGSSSRCSKTSDALNSAVLYFCDGSRLYKGKDNQGLFGSSSRCSKTSDALNSGVLYFCEGSRLYKGKDNQGSFGSSSRCQKIADAENESLK